MSNTTTNQRIFFVDVLKGLAIFLMVMGHVLSWQWGGANNSLQTEGNPAFIVRNFIYSFHMPLFFFLSGYVFNTKMNWWNFSSLRVAVQKRFVQLIIPGLTALVITFLLRKTICFPWFLRTLFEIYLINVVIYIITQRFNHNIFAELGFQAIFLIVVKILSIQTVFFNQILDLNTCFLNAPYFFLGTIAFRYKFIDILKKHYCFFSLALPGWIILFWYGQTVTHITHHVTSILAIITATLIFGCGDIKQNIFIRLCSHIGKYTLPIYLWSIFFTPQTSILGQYIDMCVSQGTEFAIASQILIGTFFSIYAIAMSYLFAKLMEPSPLLSLLFLGKTTNKKNNEKNLVRNED